MAVIFGLAAALTYGAADFLGGLATRRTKVLSVVLLSQVAGSLVLAGLIPFFIEVDPTGRALVWGALAGVAGAGGVAIFYQGLAIGRMGVVAPITGVGAATIPIVFGLATGERPSAIALTGVILALVAVGLISKSSEATELELDAARPGRLAGWMESGIAHALASGVGFGVFFILLDRAGEDTGLWPLLGVRGGSMITIVVALIASRGWDRPPRSSAAMIVGSGILDVSANVLYLLAAQRGLLSIAAVLTSMYPAATLLLARIALKERFERIQVLGLVVAAVAVSAIALG
ncbi:MAG TPA: EamA family transporter [Actinomycetota bacterium]|nr:EamA family transporter [Actinomycetota bacterium]